MSNNRVVTFAEYLDNATKIELLDNMIVKYFRPEGLYQNFSRVFNDICQGDKPTYIDQTPALALDKLTAVQQSLQQAFAAMEGDYNDPEALREVASPAKVEAWFKLVYAQILKDLFDLDGNIRAEIKAILNRAKLSDEEIEAGGNVLKQALLSSYMTNVFFQSEHIIQAFPVGTMDTLDYNGEISRRTMAYMKQHEKATIDRTFMNEYLPQINELDGKPNNTDAPASLGVYKAKVNPSNFVNKWLPALLIGLVIAIGIAAIIATTVLTAGAALPVWAIAAYAVGATLVAGGAVGATIKGVRDTHKKESSYSDEAPSEPGSPSTNARLLRVRTQTPSPYTVTPSVAPNGAGQPDPVSHTHGTVVATSTTTHNQASPRPGF